MDLVSQEELFVKVIHGPRKGQIGEMLKDGLSEILPTLWVKFEDKIEVIHTTDLELAFKKNQRVKITNGSGIGQGAEVLHCFATDARVRRDDGATLDIHYSFLEPVHG